MAERLTFVVQETQDGYGHAVYQARELVGEEPFLITLGDHVYFSDTDVPCARQVLDASSRYGASVTSVAYAPEADLHRYGTLSGAPARHAPPVYEINALVEKPTVDYARAHLRAPGLPDGQYLVHFGIHAFTPVHLRLPGASDPERSAAERRNPADIRPAACCWNESVIWPAKSPAYATTWASPKA